MTPVTAYKAILRELDKFGSPDFTKSDFNYFFNKALRNTLSAKAKNSELSPGDNKEISRYLILGRELAGASPLWTLPEGFGEIKAVFATSAVTTDEAKRLTSTTKGYTLHNWFLKPTAHRFYFEEAEGSIHLHGTGISSVKLDYYRKPAEVDLIAAPAEPLDMSQGFLDDVVMEATRLMLENVADPRYQSQIQESQIRNL